MSAMRRIVFGPPGAESVGTLVEPDIATAQPDTAAVPARRGVVICDPFGIEALAANRSLNHLAASLVRAGVAVLRFAPPGFGDSADLAVGDSMVEAWQSAIGSAIDTLRIVAGCERVAVVGLRLGAALAAEVTSGRDDVDRLVLWAPVAGRPFTRELKMLGGAGAAAGAENEPRCYAVEAGGYGLTQRSVDELATIDPSKLALLPASDILVVDRDDVASAGKLVTHLQQLGARVESPALEGYRSMRLDDPEEGDVPLDSIRAITAWITAPEGATTHAPPVRRPATDPVEGDDRLLIGGASGAVVESAMTIEVDGSVLHGIATTPTKPGENGLTIVLLTTGSNPCCGAGRLHTRMARHWARNGHHVLRIDRRTVGVTELGELLRAEPGAAVCGTRRTRPEGALGEAYDDVHVADAATIERVARGAFDPDRVVLVGTCSGAYTAYRAAREARAGDAAVGLIAINQIIFDDHAWTTDGESPAYAIKARYELGQALRHPSRWLDLVRGEIPIIPTLRRLGRFAGLKARVASQAALARLRGRPAPSTGISADVQAIAAAGTALVYVFDEAETGLGYLRLHTDSAMSALQSQGRITHHTVNGAGHTFGPEWSKRWLTQTLDRALESLGR